MYNAHWTYFPVEIVVQVGGAEGWIFDRVIRINERARLTVKSTNIGRRESIAGALTNDLCCLGSTKFMR